MTDDIRWSRPLRWASEVSGIDEQQLRDYLRNVRVALRLESGFDHPDAREAFLLSVNMLLRFCPRLVVITDTRILAVAIKARALALAILQTEAAVEVLTEDPDWTRFDAVLTVGRRSVKADGALVINSNGWVARLGTTSSIVLPWTYSRANAVGALTAACLGVGATAAILLRMPGPPQAFELSMFNLRTGPLQSLAFGPMLPVVPPQIHAVVFGCGGVTNGWAYAVRRLPIRGALEAVDMQSLRKENLGPYVLSTWADLDKSKAALIKKALSPGIKVTSRPEPLEFYKIRLDQGLVEIPRIMIAGLDAIAPRHVVQRLWPDVLIDMASGGTTTQLVVHHAGGAGCCLLEALELPDGTADFAQRMADATGLSAQRIRNNPTDPISEEDIAAAPPEHRGKLETARRTGRLVCGRVTEYNLSEEGYSTAFHPAVPFVSALSGIAGAAETMKALMGASVPFHHQFEFGTMRSRRRQLERSSLCECSREPNRG
jgi:hypothetical protein